MTFHVDAGLVWIIALIGQGALYGYAIREYPFKKWLPMLLAFVILTGFIAGLVPSVGEGHAR